MLRLLLLLSLMLSLPAWGLPQNRPVPGGIAVVTLPDLGGAPAEVSYAGNPVTVQRDGGHWQAVVGIALDAEPGEHHVEVRSHNGALAKRFFEVEPHEYGAEYITIKNRRKVTPNASDLERIAREHRQKAAVLETFREDRAHLAFQWPVKGRISGEFGTRRFFNDKPRSPHSGVDIAAPRGTPIRAPAPGRVALVGDFFFSGNCVYVDHGQGVVSFYAHLDQPRVSEGDTLARGEVLGTVGATGRVTGAHLHWGLALNRQWVDPRLLLAAGE